MNGKDRGIMKKHEHPDHFEAKTTHGSDSSHRSNYRRLLAMTVLSFVAMYGLMYAMVDSFPNVFNSLNQVYMAGLMTGAMVLIELALMRSMYPHKHLNLVLLGAGTLVLAGCWFGIRSQAGIGDKQFLRSMIPHHAGALLMCEQADIKDPEIKKLCETIKRGQQSEIEFMKRKLQTLQR